MATVLIEWVDSNSLGLIGYNVYKNGTKINTSLIGNGVQQFYDNNATKDVNNTYVVQSVTSNSESTTEVINENKKSITPTETSNLKQWQLLWDNDFSGGSIGEVRGFNGASVAVVNGLLENWKNSSSYAGIIPNTPAGGWVSQRMYKLEFTINSVTSTELPKISVRQTWGADNIIKFFDLKETGLPYTFEFGFSRNNVTLSSGIIVQSTGFIAGDIMRFSNVKFYQLI